MRLWHTNIEEPVQQSRRVVHAVYDYVHVVCNHTEHPEIKANLFFKMYYFYQQMRVYIYIYTEREREIIKLYYKCIRNKILNYIYRVSQEECARIRDGIPYIKVYRWNPKHL